MKYLKIFWKPLFWLALICYSLFIPAKNLPLTPLFSIPHFDKMVHFVLFFVLCLLLIRPLKSVELKHRFYAPFFTVLLSALLELCQHTISSSRNSNIYDFLANAAGALFATVFFRLLVSNRKWEKLF